MIEKTNYSGVIIDGVKKIRVKFITHKKVGENYKWLNLS